MKVRQGVPYAPLHKDGPAIPPYWNQKICFGFRFLEMSWEGHLDAEALAGRRYGGLLWREGQAGLTSVNDTLAETACGSAADGSPRTEGIGVIELATQYGRYGYRRVTELLRREGWRVNHKRVERIWRKEGLKVPQRQRKRRRLWLNDGSCIRRRPEYKNHVWSYDFVLDPRGWYLPSTLLGMLVDY